MLGYRHIFHAGNVADVVKHTVLLMLLEALCRKDTPYCVLDTHAGIGLYDLHDPQARQNAEYAQGIARLLAAKTTPPAPVAAYLEAVRAANPGPDPLRYYPGSPWLARRWLRPQDRLVLTELNQADYAALKAFFEDDRQVAVHLQDAYQGMKAFLPPKERRGLVLIDPAYELKDEYERLVPALAAAWRRWPTGMYAVWYPVQTASQTQRLYEAVAQTGMRKILRAELTIRPPKDRRLNGSGLLIVNPPWQLEQPLAGVLDWLWQQLVESRPSGTRVDWLIPE